MREILFRGKRLDNGEWVEGGVLCYAEYTAICVYSDYNNWHEFIEVDPKTVCQFTGLTDKKDNKIWENDVCQYIETNSYGTVIESETFIVKYGRHGNTIKTNLGFYVEWLEMDHYRTDICHWTEKRHIEVIGNIFDNPELMEGEIDVHM